VTVTGDCRIGLDEFDTAKKPQLIATDTTIHRLVGKVVAPYLDE
jgi:hypothetical protein